MKRIFFLLLPATIGTMLFLACKKQYTVVAGTNGVGTSAYLKVVHASPNFDSIFHMPYDSLNVYFGSSKVTATALKFGTGYPVAGGSTFTLTYAAVPSGTQNIRVSVAGVVNKDSATVASFTRTLTAGAYYTLVITDSINSPRDSSRIWIQDRYPQPTAGPGYFYLRFMHAVQDGIGDTVDLYSPRRNQVLFSKVKVDSTTPFTQYATTLGVADTLYVRRTGTATVLAKLNTFAFGDQQFYTSYYVGDTAALPAAKTRTLLTYQNR